jgi:hypothetical protein
MLLCHAGLKYEQQEKRALEDIRNLDLVVAQHRPMLPVLFLSLGQPWPIKDLGEMPSLYPLYTINRLPWSEFCGWPI